MDCRVVLEAAVVVYDVETADEAIRIAISKTGKQINPELSYVEIEVGERTTPSGDPLDPVCIVAGQALVALTLEMDVFNVDREQHAARIARAEIGSRLEDVALEVLEIEVTDDDTDDERRGEENSNDLDGQDQESRDTESGSTRDTDEDSSSATADTATGAPSDSPDNEDDSDILPTFEELIEE